RELAARDAAMAETLIACRTLLECQVVGDERSVATEHSLAETTARLTALRHRSRDNAQAFREIVAGIYGRRCRQLAAQQGDRPPSSSELADVLAELATMNGRLLAERETVRQLAEEREARAELVEELEERKDEADHFRATIRRLLTRKPIPNDVPETEPKGPRDTPRM
ncbi:MAG: hypothetical protein HON70_00665, partial [Lentisphaerae bacterium]|nr:hypothetical protein [Lentisphaerota bacterium]